MRSIFVLAVAVAVVGLGVTGCGERETVVPEAEEEPNNHTPDGGDEEVQGIKAGQAVRPLGTLSYRSVGGSPDDGGVPLNMCGLTFNAGSVAILEVTSEVTVHPRRQDCTGPYARDGLAYEVRTLAVASGPELPREFTLVAVGHETIVEQYPGDILVGNVRAGGPEWFLGLGVGVQLDGLRGSTRVDLPPTFEELSAMAMDHQANLQDRCPELAEQRVDDEAWLQTFKGANTTPCDDEVPECEGPDCPQPGR